MSVLAGVRKWQPGCNTRIPFTHRFCLKKVYGQITKSGLSFKYLGIFGRGKQPLQTWGVQSGPQSRDFFREFTLNENIREAAFFSARMFRHRAFLDFGVPPPSEAGPGVAAPRGAAGPSPLPTAGELYAWGPPAWPQGREMAG
jgi:hypothetical protein